MATDLRRIKGTRTDDIGDYEVFGTYRLSKLWHVSQQTIRNWIDIGRLRAIRPKFASGFLVTGKELKRFVNEEIDPDGQE